MDRLKSLRSRNYQQLRKSQPDDDCAGNDMVSFLGNRDIVVSIDDGYKGSGIHRDTRVDQEDGGLAERRASSLPSTNGTVTKVRDVDEYTKKAALAASDSGRRERVERAGDLQVEPDKKVLHGIWRECSYDFLGDSESESWDKKAQAERKKDRRGTSFDFGVPVDPPSRLIGNFLQMQREMGGNALDMDLEAPGLDDRDLSPLSEASESIKDVSEDGNPSARFPRLDSFRPSPSSAALSTAKRENGAIEGAPKSQFAELFASPPTLPTIKLQAPVRPASAENSQHGGYESPSGSGGRDGVSSGLRARRPTSKGSSEAAAAARPAATPVQEEEIIKSPTRRKSMNFSRLRSRLAEPPIPRDNSGRSGLIGARPRSGQIKSQQLRSQQLRSGLVGRTGLLGKVEEEDDPFKDVDLPEKYKGNKWGWIVCLEWIALVVLAGTLVCSTVVPRLRDVQLWGLELWKWVTLVLVIVCGRLVSDWIIRIVVFFIERNFLLRKRVLYFVYALRRGVQNCMWLAFVLLAWHLLFRARAQRATKILLYITKVLQCFLLAAALAVVKTFLVKVLASGFHMGTYFERIRDSLFNQYVLETLSGPPVLELQQSFSEQRAIEAEVAGLRKAGAFAPGLTTDPVNSTRKSPDSTVRRSGILSRNSESADNGTGSAAILTIDKLHNLNQKNISAWNMKRLIHLVKHTGVATLTHNFDDSVYSDTQTSETEITSEYEAKVAAKQVFKNVAKPGRKFIVEDDLLRFMDEDEVARALPLFDGAVETGKITPQALKNYVINVYRERRALALSLSDTKTAVNKLHRIINVVLTIAVVVIWLLILGIATTQLLVFISSQLLLVVFVFGNTCKNVFEAIVFLFVMHPFDVGDRCVIDGNQMVVEEMNILTTVFLGDCNAKVWYPNSVLATKPIQNFYRSPDMGDSFEFVVHASTPAEKIAQLKERVGKYVAAKPHHWKPAFSMLVLDLAEASKMKLSLGLSHTMNHQDFGEKVARRSDLLWEMRRLFEELGIEYHLPPQEVHLWRLGGDPPKTA